MFLLKADPMAEGDSIEVPGDILEVMNKFNEDMNAAGVLLGGEGFRPTSVDSYRLTYSPDKAPSVTKGPFDVAAEAHVCGWWMVQTKDAEEALEWAKKVPMPMGEIVVPRIGDADDMGEAFTKEMRQRENRLRLQVAERVRDLAEKELGN